MANELVITYTGENPMYAIVFNHPDHLPWNNTTEEFEIYDEANIDDYAVELTDSGSNLYVADMPTGVATGSTYHIQYYEQATEIRSEDDFLTSEHVDYGVSEDVTDSDDIAFVSDGNWRTVMVTMVRHLIGDLSDTEVYEDSRIEQALVVAGIIATQEYSFDTDYQFDLDTPDMYPDPTEAATRDNLAVALFTLKAACMLSMNSYQSAVGKGIKVRDGDSEVDTTGSFKGYDSILKMGPCAAYKDLIKSSYWKYGTGKGKAVIGPGSCGTGASAEPWGMGSVGRSTRSFFDSYFYW